MNTDEHGYCDSRKVKGKAGTAAYGYSGLARSVSSVEIAIFPAAFPSIGFAGRTEGLLEYFLPLKESWAS